MRVANSKITPERQTIRRQAGFLFACPLVAILAPLIVLVCLSLFQISVYSSAHTKGQLISKQVALFAANSFDQVDIEEKSKRLVQELLNRSGSNCNLRSLSVKTAQTGDDESMKVRLELGVPVLSVIPSVPPAMGLICEATVALPVNRVCGCIVIQRMSETYDPEDKNVLYLPIIRPRKEHTVWAAPFDANLNSLRLAAGASPVPPACGFNLVAQDAKSLY